MGVHISEDTWFESLNMSTITSNFLPRTHPLVEELVFLLGLYVRYMWDEILAEDGENTPEQGVFARLQMHSIEIRLRSLGVRIKELPSGPMGEYHIRTNIMNYLEYATSKKSKIRLAMPFHFATLLRPIIFVPHHIMGHDNDIAIETYRTNPDIGGWIVDPDLYDISTYIWDPSIYIDIPNILDRIEYTPNFTKTHRFQKSNKCKL